MNRILISDDMSPRAAEVFQERGLCVDVRTGMDPDALTACIGDYDALVVRSTTKVTAAAMDAAPNLRVIGRAGIGVDNIDVAAATQRGVVVMNTPYGNSVTTAEHALALLFALARRIPAANESTHAGKWEKSRFVGVELMGKTLGIVGCGNVGSVVAERALALKMKVIAFDPYLTEERAADLGVDKVKLDQLFARADFISLHTPLTDGTRGLICADSIAKMKDGVRIINCARGGLIVEEDLKAALESGRVAGAAVDVFTEEPAQHNVLFNVDGVVATPHLGASTSEAQEKVAVQVAEQISDLLLTGAVCNAVNMPSVSAKDMTRLKPYLALVESMGSFLGQISDDAIRGVSVEYEGQVTRLNTQPLTASALSRVLAHQLDNVNAVNAQHVARERDISMAETKHERRGEYLNLVRLSVETEHKTRSVAGTVVGGGRPRIVQIDHVDIEAEFGPHMLFARNRDKPGFIGALGTLLGDKGYNIATFHLGRTAPGEDAMSLIELDQPLDPQLLDKVRNLPHVLQSQSLTF